MDLKKRSDSNVTESFIFNPDVDTQKHARHLPHWQQGEAFIFVTWRLADSLPQTEMDAWRAEQTAWMRHHPKPWSEREAMEFRDRFFLKVETCLDRGMGDCVLRNKDVAGMVSEAMHHFDGERYRLAAYAIMPNHVHVLFRPLEQHLMFNIVKGWKGFTAREINRFWGVPVYYGKKNTGID